MGLGSWLKKKSKAEQASPGLSLKHKLAIWWATKWYEDGLKGKKGGEVMEFLKKLQGLRSAILLLFLLAEGVCRAFGLEAGPLFAILHGLFGSLQWTPDAQTTELASQVVVVVSGVWFACQRAMAWYKQHYGSGAGK